MEVRFDTDNLGPGNYLQIEGVTISDSTGGGQVATEIGGGLGNSKIEPNYSIDRRMHFQAGSFTCSENILEGLDLSVDGVINSLTIVPYFSVVGPGNSVKLPFEIGYFPLCHNSPESMHYRMIDPVAPGPITIAFNPASLPYRVNISPASNWGQALNFRDYLSKEGYPDVIFQFGFSIQSLDYTPANVPSPHAFHNWRRHYNLQWK